ncbi:hypothetical protein GCM10028807_10980 [Spirosoma daeguense]
MRYFFLLWYGLLFCLSTVAVAQQKLEISATGAPTFVSAEYNYRYFYPDSDGQIVEPIFMNGKRLLPGFVTGLTATYTYSPGWSVSSGIWYQQLTTRQARMAIAGYGRTTVHHRTIRIPILLNYRLTQKRLSPYFSFGTMFDFPMASRVIAEREGLPTQRLRLSADKGPIFNILLGAGVQYQLSNQLSLMVQPQAIYKLGRFGGADAHDTSYEFTALTQIAYKF